MRAGAHNKKIKSARWLRVMETTKFKPRLFSGASDLRGSCGTCAIATLTGLNPKEIDRQLPKNTDYWKDLHVKKFLRKHGYEITEVTISRVTQNPDWQEDPITGKHVLLVSQEVLYGEATWAVLYGYKRYHNFEEDQLHLFEFVNNPLMTVYIVSHPKWGNMPPKNYRARYCPRRDKYISVK